MSEPIGPVRDPHGALDEDLYCLTCGYNLRGLSGDPVRCPECGAFNDLGTVRLPATAIRAALRDMESSPTFCVACAVAFAAFSPLLFTGISAVALFAAVAMICMIGGWLAAFREMRRDYDDRPGWKSILLQYHGAMALCLTILLLPVGLGFYFETRRRIITMQRDKAVRVARDTIRNAMRNERAARSLRHRVRHIVQKTRL